MKNSLKNLMYGALFALPYAASAQTFTETFGVLGAPGSTSAIATASPGFVNTGFTYTGTADVRNTSPSTTVVATGYASASGDANIFITNTVGKYFEISGINTSALTSLALSFGVSKNVNNSDGSSLSVQTSTDGVNYTSLTIPVLPTGTGTSHWYLRTATGVIPSVANLRIRFTNTTVTTQFRIDDVKLVGSCVASITPSGATTLCNGGNVVLTANAGASYLWSNGATTQTISANLSATYNVTVTAIGGCTAVADPVRVLVYPAPNVGGSATSICGVGGGTSTLTARTFAPDLFFSEYVEGSSNEKYIEIYNGTGSTVNLSDYVYQAFHNGTVTPTFADTLSGTLADGAVLVLQNNAAGLYTGGIPTFKVAHNGNDALALYKMSTASYVDIFGVIGVDPIANWTGTGSYSTLDHTLRRKSSVYAGITVNPALPGQSGFSTLVSEWDLFAIDDVSGLGSHTMDGSYSWSAGTSPSTGKVVTASPSSTTIYSVTGNYAASGCSGTGTVQVIVTEAVPSVVIDNDLFVITTCFGPQCSDFNANVSGGTAPYTFSWSNGPTTQTVVVCPTVSGSYTVTATDANGCSAQDVTSIEVINACCSGTNVIVCTGTETVCVDSAAVQALIDGGDVVGPCSVGGRMAAPKTAASIKNSNTTLNVYPNPFSETAALEVKLTEGSNVKIEVMDITGKKVAELNNSALQAGTYKFNWNGTNTAGNTVVNGLYFCRMISGNTVQTVKIQKVSGQ